MNQAHLVPRVSTFTVHVVTLAAMAWGAGCGPSSACGSNEVEENGACLVLCNNSRECTQDKACVDGRCVPGSGGASSSSSGMSSMSGVVPSSSAGASSVATSTTGTSSQVDPSSGAATSVGTASSAVHASSLPAASSSEAAASGADASSSSGGATSLPASSSSSSSFSSSSASSSLSSSSGTSSSTMVVVPWTPVEFVTALLNAECDFRERCAEETGRYHSTPDECRRQGALQALEFGAFFGMSTYELLGGLLVTSSDDQARACVETLAASSRCDLDNPFLQEPTCVDAITWTSGRLDGEPCTEGSILDLAAGVDTACAPAFQCRTSGAEPCGTCRAPKANGEGCEYALECASNFCNTLTGLCSAPPTVGQPCDGACAGALICTSAAPRTCVARGGEGSPCTSDYECVGDLDCTAGSCVRRLQDGETCTAGRSTPQCTVFCILESTATNMGVCGLPDALPGEGAPCVYARGRPLCAQGTYPDVAVDTVGDVVSCKCVPLLAEGSTCRDHLMCASSLCSPEDLCRPPYVVGEECPGDFACESGNCAWNEAENVSRCEPPLMCN